MRILTRFALPLATLAALAVAADAVAQNNQTPRFRDDLRVAGAQVKGSSADHFMTFSGPFSLPGTSLPAGTYVFQKLSGGVLRVMSTDRRHVYLAIHTSSAWRRDTAGYQAMWEENIVSAPPRLKAWFAPGSTNGQALVYPAIEAPRQIASR